MGIVYDSRGLARYVPDKPTSLSSAIPKPGLWNDTVRPAISALGGIVGTPLRGAGMLAGLAQEALGGDPRVKITADSGLLDDITGSSYIGPTAPGMAVEGAKLLAMGIGGAGVDDVIGERLDASKSSGLAEFSPEERRSWQESHPVAAYTKAVAEPVAELAFGMALDPSLGIMSALSSAGQASNFLRAADASAKIGKTQDAVVAAKLAASTLKASKTVQTIVSGASPVGSFMASHPSLSLGAERALGAAFVPSMALGAAEQGQAAYQGYKDEGLTPDVLRAGLEAASSGAFALIGAKHALAGTPLSPTDRIAEALRISSEAAAEAMARPKREVPVVSRVAPAEPIVAQPAPVNPAEWVRRSPGAGLARVPEPIIGTNKREVFAALKERYGENRPSVKEMIDRHGIPNEWAFEAKSRWDDNVAYRVRSVGEQGIPSLSHAQASRGEAGLAEARAYASNRAKETGMPQEIVKVDLDKVGVPFKSEPRGELKSDWVKFESPVPEELVRVVERPSLTSEVAASEPAPAPVVKLLEASTPETLAEPAGLSLEQTAKGIEDVKKDSHFEFSPEAQAVKRVALDMLPPTAEIGVGVPDAGAVPRVLGAAEPVAPEAVPLVRSADRLQPRPELREALRLSDEPVRAELPVEATDALRQEPQAAALPAGEVAPEVGVPRVEPRYSIPETKLGGLSDKEYAQELKRLDSNLKKGYIDQATRDALVSSLNERRSSAFPETTPTDKSVAGLLGSLADLRGKDSEYTDLGILRASHPEKGKKEFDREILELAKAGKIELVEAESFVTKNLTSEEDINRFVSDGKKLYFVAKSSHPKSPERYAPIVIEALSKENPQTITNGALAYIPNIRKSLSSVFKTKEEFDRALLRLFTENKIELQSHSVPSQIPAALAREFIPDGKGSYFLAIGLREDEVLRLRAKKKGSPVEYRTTDPEIEAFVSERPFLNVDEALPRISASLGKGYKVERVGDKMAVSRVGQAPFVHVDLAGRIEIDPVAFKAQAGYDLPERISAIGASGETRKINGEAFISLAKGKAGEGTLHHEILHAASDLIDPKLTRAIESKYGTGAAGWEKAAKAYEKWAPGHKDTLFQRIYDFFRGLYETISGKRDEAAAAFRDIRSGKALDTGAALVNPRLSEALSYQVNKMPAERKREIAIAIARDLGIEDIIRHEVTADGFVQDIEDLLRADVTRLQRPSPMGVAFLRATVDPKTNYGNYEFSLSSARFKFGSGLRQQFLGWVNSRRMTSLGEAWNRIKGVVGERPPVSPSHPDRLARRDDYAQVERAIRDDLNTSMPDIESVHGVMGIGPRIGTGSFNEVFDIGPDYEGVPLVARIARMPGVTRRPYYEHPLVAKEFGRYWTSDGREVTILEKAYTYDSIGKDRTWQEQQLKNVTARLEKDGWGTDDLHRDNLLYRDKQGKKPIVVDFGAVRSPSDKTNRGEVLAYSTPEFDADAYTRLFEAQTPMERRIENAKALGSSYISNLRYLFVDKLDPLRKVERANPRGRAEDSPASAFEVVSSRAADKIDRTVESAKDNISALIASNKSTSQDVGLRLVVEHAPVRNRWGRERGVEDASGISDAQAAEIQAKMMEEGRWDKALPAVEAVRGLLRNQRELYKEYDLISPERVGSWEADPEWERTYVPLKHEDLINPWAPKTGGGGVRKQGKSFAGRSQQADNPIGYALSQVAETIAIGEKNKAAQVLAKFVEDNPQLGWQVRDSVPTHNVVVDRVVDGRTIKQVQEAPDMRWVDNNALPFQQNGQTKYIEISNPQVLDALRKVGPDSFSSIVRLTSKTMRAYASLLTTYNPEFLIPNFARDMQMALVGIGIEKGAAVAQKTFGNTWAALKGSWSAINDPNAKGEWQDAFREYAANGGRMRTLEVKAGPKYLEKVEKEVNRLTKPNQFTEAFKKTMGAIDMLNGGVETAVRLSYYKALREAGVGINEAVAAGKNLTVNFDRRGAVGPQLNSLYLFFNASVQGASRTLGLLKSPRGRAAAGALLSAGFAADQANAAMSEDKNGDGISDWDSVPEYVKSRNVLLGKLMIPMPYGFNVVFNTGRLVSAALRGAMSPGQAASHAALAAMDAFNPIGGGTDLTQMITPTIADPFVQLATNTDFAGNPIVPDQPKWGAKKPDSERFWRSTNAASRWIAQSANRATGGDKVTSGFVDISPESIDHWVSFALGGWGRIISGGASVAESVSKGEMPSIRKVPILRRALYEEHPGDTGRIWRATTEELLQLKERAKYYRGDGQIQRYNKLPKPLLGLIPGIEKLARKIQDIQAARNSGRLTDQEAEQKVRELQIYGLKKVGQARERARAMGYAGGYQASPGSGV